MKKHWHITVIILLFVFVTIGWSVIFAKEVDWPESFSSNSLIRLHVLANSDSAEDQRIKLEVRDAVIAHLAPHLEKATSVEEARQAVIEHKSNINEIANRILEEHNVEYTAQIQVGMFEFPVKSYGSILLPAGKYEAVRILIGNAEGKNWWCVLFPPLCFIDITNATAIRTVESVETKKPDSQVKEVTKVEFRSKLLEILKDNR